MINSKNIPKKEIYHREHRARRGKASLFSVCAVLSVVEIARHIFDDLSYKATAENKGHRKIKMDREALECKGLFRFVLEVSKDTKSERGLLHKAIRRSSTMMLFLCVFAFKFFR